MIFKKPYFNRLLRKYFFFHYVGIDPFKHADVYFGPLVEP
jgi:hypothetical protein